MNKGTCRIHIIILAFFGVKEVAWEKSVFEYLARVKNLANTENVVVYWQRHYGWIY